MIAMDAPNPIHDHPGVQGLAQLGRNAIDRVIELERKVERLEAEIEHYRWLIEQIAGGTEP